MAAILSSVREAVREEVRVAVAAQVPGAAGLLQAPRSLSENPSGASLQSWSLSSGAVRGGLLLEGSDVMTAGKGS